MSPLSQLLLNIVLEILGTATMQEQLNKKQTKGK
jgi:hypothetical protein